MKETVSKEYRTIDGQEYKIEIYYNLGGSSYSTSKPSKRGYYVAVVPVERETMAHGIISEKVLAFSGVKHLLNEVNRKSVKAADKAEELLTEELIQSLLNYVIEKTERRAI